MPNHFLIYPTNHNHLTHPKYRSDIDGMRALAVLSVVGFHAFPSWIKGGFIGVDIFFVISGYLISTIIITSLEQNRFGFLEFYARRVNRIFPALIMVLLACITFGYFALLADEYKQLGKHIAGGTGFISNIIFWDESGYFDNISEKKPLLHLWSLGIEEQFYVLWPLFLWLAWKVRSKLNLLFTIIAVTAISFLLNIFTIHEDSIAAFYSPQTRFWELLSGAILAYMQINGLILRSAIFRAKESEVLNVNLLCNLQSILGFALIIYGFLFITKENLFPGWWALLPTAGTVLIISAGERGLLNRAVLSNRVLVWFGLISYPLYLYHWPLLSFVRIIENQNPSEIILIFTVFISIALAWLTYRFIEEPFHFIKDNRTNRSAFILIVLMIIIGFVGYTCFDQDGYPLRPNLIGQTPEEFDWLKMSKNRECEDIYPDAPWHCTRSKSSDPTILLLGDSHSEALYPGMAHATANSADSVMDLSVSGCPPFFGIDSRQIGREEDCADQAERALLFAQNYSSIKTVILTTRGPLYIYGKGYFEPDHNRTLTLRKQPEITDFRQVFSIAMSDTIKSILTKKIQIIFVLDTPELGFDPRSCDVPRPLTLTKHPESRCGISRQAVEERNREYRELVFNVLKEFPSVLIFDAMAHICDAQQCLAMKDGNLLYRDDDHLSVAGSRYISMKLVDFIRTNHR
jgi:peptidoglycan/LPS O-acetylase OafA/YrhL